MGSKMTFKNTLKNAFLPVAMALTSLIASPAYAVEMGKDGCLAPAELMAQLKAEGQGSVIAGQRIIPKSAKNPQETTVFAFSTALKSGEFGKGYSFEADKPNGETGFKLCMTGEYYKARALDVSKAEVPAYVDSNSNLFKSITWEIKNGLNPIYYGEKNGAITVIVGAPQKKDQFNGTIVVGNNDPTRKSGTQGGFIGLGYTPQYIQSLAQAPLNGQTVAAADLKPRP